MGVLEQFPRTGAGHPDSRFRDSPRILEPGQISRSRYRRAESKLRASPCNLEIGRQNTDSKFRGSCFCLRSCTVPSSATHTLAGPPELRWGNSLLPRLGEGRASGTVTYHRLATQGGGSRSGPKSGPSSEGVSILMHLLLCEYKSS